MTSSDITDEPIGRTTSAAAPEPSRRGRDLVLITSGRGIQETLLRRTRGELPLLWLWTRRNLRARYRQSVLRASWSVVQPVVLLVTYGLVLTTVANVGNGSVPYLVFAWAGLVPYIFVQQALGSGVGTIQQSRHIITKVYFPREVLPLSAVGVAFADLLVMTAILIVLSWFQVGAPTIHLLGLVPTFAVLLVWTTGVTVLAAAAAVFYRDVLHVMPLVLRVLFIISPVMYATSLLTEHATALVDWNPLAVAIEATRDSVIDQQWPDWGLLGFHLVSGAAVLLVALLVTRRFERRMSDRA